MYCRACGYELKGLNAGACPECGRGFDPREPTSFISTAERKQREKRWRWLAETATLGACWPLIVFAWMHLMLVVARLVLGRWPHRMGRDDPKYIEIVGGMHWIGSIALMAMPLLVLWGVVGLMMFLVHNRRAGLCRIGFVLLAWTAMVLISDRAQVGVWFMD